MYTMLNVHNVYTIMKLRAFYSPCHTKKKKLFNKKSACSPIGLYGTVRYCTALYWTICTVRIGKTIPKKSAYSPNRLYRTIQYRTALYRTIRTVRIGWYALSRLLHWRSSSPSAFSSLAPSTSFGSVLPRVFPSIDVMIVYFERFITLELCTSVGFGRMF